MYRRYVLITLLVVFTCNFVDRQILSLLMEAIKQDLLLSDTQLGFLSGIAFALFYTTMGIPIAYMADRYNRVNIISISLALWSAMTAVCGLTANFWQLLFARIGVGVGEAGCTPPSHSIIADYFSKKDRSKAISIYMTGVPLGLLFGLLIGGWLNELYGWRIAFFALGIPGVVLAIVVKLTVREPVRGQQDVASTDVVKESNDEQDSLWQVIGYLFRKHSYRRMLMATALAGFVGGGYVQWLPSYFIRTHGMATGELGTWLAMMVGVTGALGTYSGGYLTQRFAGDDETRQIRIIALLTLFMIPAAICSLLTADKHTGLMFAGLANLFFFMHFGPSFSLIAGLARPSMRAMAAAMAIFTINIISGFGPQLVGLISDLLNPSLGVDSLSTAMIIIFIILLPACWCFWSAGTHIRGDMERQ
jgi:MFS family permease